jgi:hypothetical protein
MSEAMLRFLSVNSEILCYISCNPASLARDAAVLLTPGGSAGLNLVSLSFYDFYPQTNHIESLAIFRRQRPPAGLKALRASIPKADFGLCVRGRKGR